jgi:hypothetical protein
VTPSDRAQTLAWVEAELTARLGGSPAKASVSFVGVDPMQVLRFADLDRPPDERLVTLGMSGAPMTAAQELVQSTDGPRAELLLALHPGFNLAWRQLAVLAAAPAVEGVVYAPGATVDTGTAWLDGSRCTGAVIAEADIAPIVTAGLTITLLSVLPATANELAWARVHGADALRDRWATQSVDLRDLDRPTVRLD